MRRKILAFAVAAVIAVTSLGALPVSAFAETKLSVNVPSVYEDSGLYSDEAMDVVLENNNLKGASYGYNGSTYESDVNAIAIRWKPILLERNAAFTFNYATTQSNLSTSSTALKEFITSVYSTACSDEYSTSFYDGDFLLWQSSPSSCTAKKAGVSNGIYYYTFNVTSTFYTNANDEKKVDEAVKNYFASFDASSMSDYQLVAKFHDDICNMTRYDYNYEETQKTDLYDFTEYGVFCLGRSVCQGYALAFLRLCREVGISARFVSSDELGNHAWNIVSMGGEYYYVDCTWDDDVNGIGTFSRDFFLNTYSELRRKDVGNLSRTHILDSRYNTDYFKNTYANHIATTSFNPSSDNLFNASAYLSGKDFTYSTQGIFPEISVNMGGQRVWDVNYSAPSYNNNINVGLGYVRVYGTGKYSGQWIQRSFNIHQRDISSLSSWLSSGSFVYDGTAHNPAVYVNGLIENSDFKTEYYNSVLPGIATAVLTGKGNYQGTLSLNYSILPSKVTGLKVASKSSTKIKLTWSQVPSVDAYVVSRKKNGKWVDVATVSGTAKSATVSGLKEVSVYDFAVRAVDSATGSGQISKKVGALTAPKKTKIKSKTTKSKSITVKWNKVTCTGYQVQYSTSKKFASSATKSVKISGKSKVSKKISKLKKGKKYYIRVRAYKTSKLSSGKKSTSYGAWSSKVTVVCK